jgi:hypothetical protein
MHKIKSEFKKAKRGCFYVSVKLTDILINNNKLTSI